MLFWLLRNILFLRNWLATTILFLLVSWCEIKFLTAWLPFITGTHTNKFKMILIFWKICHTNHQLFLGCKKDRVICLLVSFYAILLLQKLYTRHTFPMISYTIMKFWSMIATAVHWYFDVHKKSEKIRKLLLSMKTFDDSFFTMFINRIS